MKELSDYCLLLLPVRVNTRIVNLKLCLVLLHSGRFLRWGGSKTRAGVASRSYPPLGCFYSKTSRRSQDALTEQHCVTMLNSHQATHLAGHGNSQQAEHTNKTGADQTDLWNSGVCSLKENVLSWRCPHRWWRDPTLLDGSNSSTILVLPGLKLRLAAA